METSKIDGKVRSNYQSLTSLIRILMCSVLMVVTFSATAQVSVQVGGNVSIDDEQIVASIDGMFRWNGYRRGLQISKLEMTYLYGRICSNTVGHIEF